jgi:hypothetical protein
VRPPSRHPRVVAMAARCGAARQIPSLAVAGSCYRIRFVRTASRSTSVEVPITGSGEGVGASHLIRMERHQIRAKRRAQTRPLGRSTSRDESHSQARAVLKGPCVIKSTIDDICNEKIFEIVFNLACVRLVISEFAGPSRQKLSNGQPRLFAK